MNLDDTIVAIATGPGRGGIGVVRLAGPEARAIAAPMLRLKRPMEPGHAIFGELIEPESSERLDEVVVTFFAKPHSYTTDEIIEISAHGAPVVLRRMVELALERGARLAEPGEFTMRAFLNGRIDLAQAEAVRDLIESQTLFQAKMAAQQLEGALSKRLKPIKKMLVDLIAVMEAGIDFAEDDVAVLASETILEHVAAVREELETLEQSFAYGKIVHEGLTLAIVGRPNVGKSSLFNRLVERERAIVTATPGTTRDLVTETVAIAGLPVRLMDTAGIRAAVEEAEGIGIQKSYEALAEADLVLAVLDASEPACQDDAALLEKLEQRSAIVVESKADLALTPRSSAVANGFPSVRASALTGEGIQELRELIMKQLGANGAQRESGFLTNVRHHSLVRDSLKALGAAADSVRGAVPHEMILLDLYNALRPLDEITGETTTDDILNIIFSRFCVGK